MIFFLGSSWLSLPVPEPSEIEQSPKKHMSSSEPILDLKTDAAEALPGENHAGSMCWVPATKHRAHPGGAAPSSRHLIGARTCVHTELSAALNLSCSALAPVTVTFIAGGHLLGQAG